MEQVTPEILERIKEQSDRQKRAEKSSRVGRRLERVNNISAVSGMATLKEFSITKGALSRSAPTTTGYPNHDHEKLRSLYQQSSDNYASRQMNLQNSLNVMHQEEDDEEEELQHGINFLQHHERKKKLAAKHEMDFLALERQIVTDNLAVSSTFATVASADENLAVFAEMDANSINNNLQQTENATGVLSEIDQLLEQLAVEPSDQEELLAKFLLFENLLSTVTSIRDTTIKFWEDNKDQFTNSSTFSACANEIKHIDNAEAMGIIDDRTWFVYGMTKKANQNNIIITNTLAKIRSRLELLAQELGECPFCLDQMSPETATTLGCCHKTCTACWDNWVSLKHNQAFCPLCKHQEFVAEVINNFN
eukprot:gene10560-14186_t